MINDIKQYEIIRSFKYNFTLNLFEAGFFGLGIGISSYQTILPLFVSNLTESAILIGLIPAIHLAGWQLPQLFLANRVSRQKRYKPMVLALTIHERLPFLGLAIAAWFLPDIGKQLTLVLVFIMLIWQGLGGGVTAIAWQSLMSKIIFPNRWGAFFEPSVVAFSFLWRADEPQPTKRHQGGEPQLNQVASTGRRRPGLEQRGGQRGYGVCEGEDGGAAQDDSSHVAGVLSPEL